jgi:uncharacterized membrane protein
MTMKRYLWWSVPLFLLVLAATALVYRRLPSAIPVFVQPLIMGLLVLLWPVLRTVSPDKFKVEGFSGTWWFCGMVVAGLFAYIQGVQLIALSHGALDIGRALLGGIGIAIVLLGNVLGKVRRNFWLGVRTPWTLASDRVWYATHRLAGKTMVAGGLVALVAALAGLPDYLGTGAIIVGALVPVGFSLVYYKRLERTGGA